MIMQTIGWQPATERTILEICYWDGLVTSIEFALNDAATSNLRLAMNLACTLGHMHRTLFPDISARDRFRGHQAFLEGINFAAAQQEPQLLINAALPEHLNALLKDRTEPT